MVTSTVLAASKPSQPIEVPTKAARRLMSAAITVAGLATIHALGKARPAAYQRGPVADATSSSGGDATAGVRQEINGSERWS